MVSAFDNLHRLNSQKNQAISGRFQPIETATRTRAISQKPVAQNQQRQRQQQRSQVQFLPGRVPTGIYGYDSLIQGGFKRRSINLLSGGPGTGKTIFSMQYLINGITMFNEVGLYISFDESKENVYEDMKAFGWDLEALSRAGMFYFIEYNPSQMQEMLNEGGGMLDNLMAKIKAKRIVLESISTFLMMSAGEYSRKEQLVSLFKLLNKWDVTALLVDEYAFSTGNEFSKKILSIDFEADSISIIYYVQDHLEDERRRLIQVYKMRGTKHETRAVPFSITDHGIEIS